jgi:hypothetical protein
VRTATPATTVAFARGRPDLYACPCQTATTRAASKRSTSWPSRDSGSARRAVARATAGWQRRGKGSPARRGGIDGAGKWGCGRARPGSRLPHMPASRRRIAQGTCLHTAARVRSDRDGRRRGRRRARLCPPRPRPSGRSLASNQSRRSIIQAPLACGSSTPRLERRLAGYRTMKRARVDGDRPPPGRRPDLWTCWMFADALVSFG